MQLSASTTPSPIDANLAALFIATNASGANDATLATTGLPPAGGTATGFAEMLSDVATPASAAPMTDAPASGPLAGPAASASLANFPNWLVAATPGNVPLPVTLPAVMVADAPSIAPAEVPVVLIPTDSPATADLAEAATPAAENLLVGGQDEIVATDAPIVPSGKNVRATRLPASRATTAPKRAALPEDSPTSVTALATSVMAPATQAASAVAPDSETPVASDKEEVVSSPMARGGQDFQTPPDSVALVASVPNEVGEDRLTVSPRPAAHPKNEKLVAARRAVSPADVGAVSPAPRIVAASLQMDLEPVVTGTPEWKPQNFSADQTSPLPVLAPRRIASVPVSTPLETEAEPVAVNFGSPPMVWPGRTSMSMPSDIVPATPVACTPTVEVTAALAPEVAELVERPAVNAREFSAPVDSPVIQFDDSIPTRAEIFAAIDGRISPDKKSGASAPEKTFLSAAAKRVAAQDANLGIDVAKSETVMPTATFSNRPPLAVAPLDRALDAPVTAAGMSPAGLPTSEPAIVAHRAVDAVLTAVERFSAGDRHSVQLQFSVGGADLSVRVELRGEEVRTTFRTDSPELRNALAHEWQAASAPSADRSVRLVPPEFSSNHTAGFGAFSGDTASHQREARARRSEAEEIFSAVASRNHPAPAFVASISDSLAATVRTVSGTALHLSTLA